MPIRSLKVADYMNRHPVVFSPEMPIEQAVRLLLQARQTGGAVVDNQHAVVGFLSEQDCLKMMLEGVYHQEQSATVADCMHRNVLTVNLDMAVVDLAQQLGTQKPKVYPVVDYEQQLVGLITRGDVLRAMDLHLGDSYPG